jgi:hypothetical protein
MIHGDLVSYVFSIAVNTSNVLTHAAAYMFECTFFFVFVCPHVSSFLPCW